MKIDVCIGYDHRWPLAYAVAVKSLMQNSPDANLDVSPILLPHLQGAGLYTRTTTMQNGQMYDEVSDAPMATEFAISRFFIPLIKKYQGWTLFTDSDFLFRVNINDLFRQIDPSKAIMCVKHKYSPDETTKMNGQIQTQYSRKNWSSLMLINNQHPKNRCLTQGYLNTTPGRDLHAFKWLDDADIGELSPEWNWLEGHSDPALAARIVHFTRGTPDMPGYEFVQYADEWKQIAGTINMTKDQ